MKSIHFSRKESIRVLAFSLYGPKAASHRVRLSQYKLPLSHENVDLHISSLLDDNYLHRKYAGKWPSLLALVRAYFFRLRQLFSSHSYSLLIIYGELFPFMPFWLERLLLRKPYIYDYDDAFYLKYRSGRLSWLKPILGNKFDRIIQSACMVTAGNHELVRYARQFNNNVQYLPSVVDTQLLTPPTVPLVRDSDLAFTIGWIGSPSTAPYLNELSVPLQRLASLQPVRLLVVGGTIPSIPGVETIEVPWTLEMEQSLIHMFDVGVMPLPDLPWTRGKCAYKLIQCMACGIPVVASSVGANKHVVNSECGFLVDTPTQWFDAFRQLAENPALRQRMGASGRKRVHNHYSLCSTIPVLASTLSAAATNTRTL